MNSFKVWLSRIPKIFIAIAALAVGLVFVVLNNPLKDGCEVELTNFSRDVSGVLTSTRNKKKKLMPSSISSSLESCKLGNNQGACEGYFRDLKSIIDSLMLTPEKCFQVIQNDERIGKVLVPRLKEGIKILSLLAWGEKPPVSTAERVGWLNIREVTTFCRIYSRLGIILNEKDLEDLKLNAFSEFPNQLPETATLVTESDYKRPRALKTTANPTGQLNQDEVYKRSLFSLNCDRYQ